jgi:uncharacterized membrane protein YqhA
VFTLPQSNANQYNYIQTLKRVYSMLLPFIWGIIFAFLIFFVHNIFKFFLIRNLNTLKKINLLLKKLSTVIIIQYFFSGFLFVTGINFLSVLSVIFIPPYQPFPINLAIQESDTPFFIAGAIIMIFYPLYEIFNKEFSKSKDITEDKLIEFCQEYTKYKENTKNPELAVMKFFNDGTILVKAPEGTSYFTKNLKFSLQISQIIDYNGEQTPIYSLEIADCFFLKAGDKHAYFKVSNWIKSLEYQEQIQKLKANQELKNLKPFIKLSDNEIAEKFSYAEMKSFIKTHQKFKSTNEEN